MLLGPGSGRITVYRQTGYAGYTVLLDNQLRYYKIYQLYLYIGVLYIVLYTVTASRDTRTHDTDSLCYSCTRVAVAVYNRK